MTDTLSLGNVLFEQAEDGPHQVVRGLVAMPGAIGWLGGLAVTRRAVAELELAQQVATILHLDLSGFIVKAWAKFTAVQAGAAASRQHPLDPVIVPLATHRVRGSEEPVIEVYVGEARIARFDLRAQVELTLSGVDLKLLSGRIVSVATGSWSGTASLSCAGTELARRSIHRRALPGVLTLAEGGGVDVAPSHPVLRLVVQPAPCSGPSTIDLRASLVIGRHPSCGVVLWDDQAVAPHHAGVHLVGDVVVLDDLGSSTGTYLNGLRMTAPAILRPGDEVRVGRRNFQVA